MLFNKNSAWEWTKYNWIAQTHYSYECRLKKKIGQNMSLTKYIQWILIIIKNKKHLFMIDLKS